MIRQANQQSVSMPKAAVAACSCLVLLLLAGPLPADQEDLNTELMRATVKIGHSKSTGTGFILCRPDPRDPPAQPVRPCDRRPRLREHPWRRGHPVSPQEGVRGRLQESADEAPHPGGRETPVDQAPVRGCRRPGGRAAASGRPAEAATGPAGQVEGWESGLKTEWDEDFSRKTYLANGIRPGSKLGNTIVAARFQRAGKTTAR